MKNIKYYYIKKYKILFIIVNIIIIWKYILII